MTGSPFPIRSITMRSVHSTHPEIPAFSDQDEGSWSAVSFGSSETVSSEAGRNVGSMKLGVWSNPKKLWEEIPNCGWWTKLQILEAYYSEDYCPQSSLSLKSSVQPWNPVLSYKISGGGYGFQRTICETTTVYNSVHWFCTHCHPFDPVSPITTLNMAPF